MNRTKGRSTPLHEEAEGWQNGRTVYSWIQPSTSDQITYTVGPEWSGGRCNWKDCVHETMGKSTGMMGTYYWRYYHSVLGWLQGIWTPHYKWTYQVPRRSVPSYEFDDSVYDHIVNQLDLNTKDSVLLYSGIIQALPLVGGALKFSSILNRAARNLKRDLRRQPFTTVVKKLISADFIDRFVISPTIADARMFADATNYVLRVIQTAYERTEAPFTLRASVPTSTTVQSYSDWMRNNGQADVSYDFTEVTSGVSSTFALLTAHYDRAAISPIKLWAARCGLTRPLESAWDLVPFSFVIDWFSGASEFVLDAARRLSDQDALRGRLTGVHGLWYTTSAKRTYTWKGTGVRNTADGFQSFIPGTQQLVYQRFERHAVANPWGTLINRAQDSIPFVRWDLTTSRMKTALELVVQKFLR